MKWVCVYALQISGTFRALVALVSKCAHMLHVDKLLAFCDIKTQRTLKSCLKPLQECLLEQVQLCIVWFVQRCIQSSEVGLWHVCVMSVLAADRLTQPHRRLFGSSWSAGGRAGSSARLAARSRHAGLPGTSVRVLGGAEEGEMSHTTWSAEPFLTLFTLLIRGPASLLWWADHLPFSDVNSQSPPNHGLFESPWTTMAWDECVWIDDGDNEHPAPGLK